MRLNEPRIPPLDESDWEDEVVELLRAVEESGEVYNILKTLAHHPKLLKRWRVFANHVLFKSSLPAREREILILRVAWLCRAGYEWGHHVAIGRESGLSDEEIRRITQGPDTPGWGAFDAALLRAVDELHGDAFVSESTWNALAERYNTQQMMDVIFTVGQYNLVSMALNSLGVQQDEGFDELPK